MAIVRLDKEEGPSPPEHANWRKWPLKTGALIYVAKDRNKFRDLLEQNPAYEIWNTGERPIIIGVGAYHGKSEQFSALNYLHQRAALRPNFEKPFEEGSLKVGVRGHRVSAGNAINIVGTAMAWVADPIGKISEKVLSGARKHFLIFTEREDVSRVMHNQSGRGPFFVTAKTDARGDGSGKYITLGDVFARHWEHISGFLHKFD